MKRYTIWLSCIVLAAAGLVWAATTPKIHGDGPDKLVVESGGSIEVKDGGYLTSLRLGTGSTPDVALGADDLFVEGTVEVDGATRLDGAVTLGTTASDNVTINGSILSSVTLGANPTIAGSSLGIATTGIIFEGTTADTIEGLLTAADPTVADKTWTLPNTTGTLLTTGDDGTVSGEMLGAMSDTVILCGENAENGTIYFGPATAPFLGDGTTSYAIGSAGCDALDNATEATVDAPLVAGLSYKVTGFWCYSDATMEAGESQVFTLRSAEADTTPALTCTIGEAATFCRSTGSTTTDIVAGATLAMKLVQTSNNGDGDETWCKVAVVLK